MDGLLETGVIGSVIGCNLCTVPRVPVGHPLMSRPFLFVKEREIVRKHTPTWLWTMRPMPKAVQEWHGRVGDHEGGCGDWDEARGEQTLESPVVSSYHFKGVKAVGSSNQNPCHYSPSSVLKSGELGNMAAGT